MINRYPLWKNLLILIVVLGCGLYALPNLYPEDPAVQITHTGGALDPGVEAKIDDLLKHKNLSFKQAEREGENLLLRFSSAEVQLEAASLIDAFLDENHVVALNLAPSTPAWLPTSPPWRLG